MKRFHTVVWQDEEAGESGWCATVTLDGRLVWRADLMFTRKHARDAAANFIETLCDEVGK